MRQPSIEKLTDQLNSKYGLVVATAKRARELTAGAKPAVELPGDVRKPVSIAMEEIAEGKLDIDEPKGGIK
ncbi:MAG: DNA-directed RNA polymerase subunit omega [Peptococcaceae bacterium]|jgi:DNA-directed RNA polymerase subunit omega|nr:DNA-directed RNA polymerase subunit omega [Peptococcaceae bacterium]